MQKAGDEGSDKVQKSLLTWVMMSVRWQYARCLCTCQTVMHEAVKIWLMMMLRLGEKSYRRKDG